jgi:hypothetical protein
MHAETHCSVLSVLRVHLHGQRTTSRHILCFFYHSARHSHRKLKGTPGLIRSGWTTRFSFTQLARGLACNKQQQSSKIPTITPFHMVCVARAKKFAKRVRVKYISCRRYQPPLWHPNRNPCLIQTPCRSKRPKWRPNT